MSEHLVALHVDRTCLASKVILLDSKLAFAKTESLKIIVPFLPSIKIRAPACTYITLTMKRKNRLVALFRLFSARKDNANHCTSVEKLYKYMLQ